MKKFIIYGLFCPFTDNLHYVGKSSSYMTRPQEHLTKSHSEKINEWVAHLKTFGYAPIIKILADCDSEDELRSLESKYISNAIRDGAYLLNNQQNTAVHIMSSKRPSVSNSFTLQGDLPLMELGKYLKIARIEADLTQEELAKKSKISILSLQLIETGKCSTGVRKLYQILNALNLELCVQKKDLFFTEVVVEPISNTTPVQNYRQRVTHSRRRA